MQLAAVMATAFAPIRLDVDTTDPFVMFSMESSRINTTFRQILDALGAVQDVMGSVVKKVDSHDEDISRVRNVFESLTARVDAHDKRFDGIETQLRGLSQKQAESEKILKEHDSKLTAIEQRLKAAEQIADQIKLLNNELSLVKTDVKQLQKVTADHDTDLKTHTNQIQKCNESLAAVQKKQDAEAARVKGIYDVFEIDEAKMKVALASKATVNGFSAQTAFCHTLPSFSGIRAAIVKDMEAVEARLQEQFAGFQKRMIEEIQVLRGKLGEKVDRREYEPFVLEVKEELRRISEYGTQIAHLQQEVKTKANKEECEKRLNHLDLTKAEKGDLIGLLRHEDIIPVENDMRELHKAFDSLCQKMNLELKDARERASNAAGSAPPTPGGNADGSLAGRVTALEALGRWLTDNKADKKDLNELYKMLENMPSFGKKPTTPTMEEGSLKRHGSLAPLGRPTSAERRGSIPETVRPPTPPLNYTSSPIKYVPNNAKFRATASVYDSEGQKTNASVTAARAVPWEDHVTNVAKHVAGENPVPCGHVTHEMPND